MLVQLYQLSATAQAARAEAVVARACDLLRDRYAAYAAGWAGPAPPPGDERFRHDLAAAAGLALSGQDGVEGGYWQAGIGALAYAFPTYQGTGPKTDLPAAELGAIADANAEAARTEAGASARDPVRIADAAAAGLPGDGGAGGRPDRLGHGAQPVRRRVTAVCNAAWACSAYSCWPCPPGCPG